MGNQVNSLPSVEQYPQLFTGVYESSCQETLFHERIPFDGINCDFHKFISSLNLRGSNPESCVDNLKRLKIVDFEYVDSLILTDTKYPHPDGEYASVHEQISLKRSITEYAVVTDFGQRFISACVAN